MKAVRINEAAPAQPDRGVAQEAEQGSRIGLIWALGTGVGGLVGAIAARTLFPEAAFEKNPVGMHGPHLVGFASMIGLGMAIPQFAILLGLTRGRTSRLLLPILLWLPVTAASIMLMILPLWDVLGAYLLIFPPLLIAYSAPGVLALASGQWLLLRWAVSAPPSWIWRTVVGTSTGITVGLVAGVFAAAMLESEAVLEPTWAMCTGALMAILQGPALVHNLARPDVPRPEVE